MATAIQHPDGTFTATLTAEEHQALARDAKQIRVTTEEQFARCVTAYLQQRTLQHHQTDDDDRRAWLATLPPAAQLKAAAIFAQVDAIIAASQPTFPPDEHDPTIAK